MATSGIYSICSTNVNINDNMHKSNQTIIQFNLNINNNWIDCSFNTINQHFRCNTDICSNKLFQRVVHTLCYNVNSIAINNDNVQKYIDSMKMLMMN